MTLSHGRHFLMIPGPTTVPDEVLQAMHRPAVDIYAGDLLATTDSILADLKEVFRTRDGRPYIYIANGHGAWDAALTNTLSRGDTVLVLESGRFAVGWGEMASDLGCVVETLSAGPSGAVDPEAVAARLAADTGHAIKAILVVQIDTATSVVNDIPAIRRAIDAAGHPALFMVDGVASIGCMPFEMDAWGVDVAMTGSQKGLMTPPGLSFVAASPRARACVGRNDLKSRYWDWEFREGEVHYHKYCGTPPEHLMFGLRRALDMLLREEGLEAAWTRHQRLADAARACVAHWARGGALDFVIPEPSARSNTVTTVAAKNGHDPEALRAFLTEHFGLTLGFSIGEACGPHGGFRIAHMGHVNAPMLLGGLGAAEAGMAALGWPGVSGGVSAAVASLAEAPEIKAAAAAAS